MNELMEGQLIGAIENTAQALEEANRLKRIELELQVHHLSMSKELTNDEISEYSGRIQPVPLNKPMQ